MPEPLVGAWAFCIKSVCLFLLTQKTKTDKMPIYTYRISYILTLQFGKFCSTIYLWKNLLIIGLLKGEYYEGYY